MNLHDDPYLPIPYPTRGIGAGDPFADTLSQLSQLSQLSSLPPPEPSSYAALGPNNPATDPTIPPARTFDDILARKAADDHETGVRCTTTLHPTSSASGMCWLQDLYCRRCYFASAHEGEEGEGEEGEGEYTVYKPCRALNCIAPAGVHRRDSAHYHPPGEGLEGGTTTMMSCPACAGPIEDELRPERWIETCDGCRNGPGMVRRSATRAKAELARAVSTRSSRRRGVGGVRGGPARTISMRSERLSVHRPNNNNGYMATTTTNSSSNTNINANDNSEHDSSNEKKKPRKSALVRKGLTKLKRVLGLDDNDDKVVQAKEHHALERKPTRSRNRAW